MTLVPASESSPIAPDIRLLAGKHILIAEDDQLIAMFESMTLEGAGASIVGPAVTVQEMVQLIGRDRVDAAVLDAELRDGFVFDMVPVLRRRRIPFILVTGHARDWVPEGLRDVPVLEKPVAAEDILEALARLFDVHHR